MKQIVCLASAPWRSRPTRTQRFLSQFTDAEILYFEPGTPGQSRKDCQRVAPMTYVYTMPVLPSMVEEGGRIHPISRWRVMHYLLGCLNYHRFHRPLLWVCSPVYQSFCSDLPHGALIYDCDQDWSVYPILWESKLTSQADLVLAASAGLQDHLSPCSKNIEVVYNGLDYPPFAPGRTEQLPCPPELEDLPTPRFGYVGTVWENLNLTPVSVTAAAHPDWSFVFVGHVHSKNPYLRALRRLPNVHFLGPKKTGEIPAYVKELTAGMSFLRDGMEDDDVLSPRIYEYLSAGIPVVSMYHPLHLEEYPSLIESAYSPEMFRKMCEKVLTEDTLIQRLSRRLLAEESDWPVRCQQVKQVVEACNLLLE